MQISKNNNEYTKNTTALKSRDFASVLQAKAGNTLSDCFSRSFIPETDKVFYRDSVSFSAKNDDFEAKEAAKATKQERKKLLQAKKRDEVADELRSINEKLTNTNIFLQNIAKTPYNELKGKNKEKLNQIEQNLHKIETQIKKIEAQIKKERETKLIKPKIDKIRKALSARENIKVQKPKAKKYFAFPDVNLTYKNILGTPLKSTPNPNFAEELRKVEGISDDKIDNATLRVSSLSKYLKEKMVGFVVPGYEFEKKEKGGYQWFERGLENLIKGSKKEGLQPEEYKDTAKELFGLLSVHDNYWKSPDFVDYLASLKSSKTINANQIKAVDATVEAIKELNAPQKDEKLSFEGKKAVSFGYYSPLREIKKLQESCAYSGVKTVFNRNINTPENLASTEHIVPHAWDPDNADDDGNYLITSLAANNKRGSIPLLDFLKGNNSAN